MKKKPRVLSIPAGRFKAECLALMDRVAKSRETLVVTKYGRPVVQVTAVRDRATPSLQGSVRFLGDIVAPVLGEWEAER